MLRVRAEPRTSRPLLHHHVAHEIAAAAETAKTGVEAVLGVIAAGAVTTDVTGAGAAIGERATVAEIGTEIEIEMRAVMAIVQDEGMICILVVAAVRDGIGHVTALGRAIVIGSGIARGTEGRTGIAGVGARDATEAGVSIPRYQNTYRKRDR